MIVYFIVIELARPSSLLFNIELVVKKNIYIFQASLTHV